MIVLPIIGMMLILFGIPTFTLSFFGDFKREKPAWRPVGLAFLAAGFACLILGVAAMPD